MITVIVPTFNRPDGLKRAVRSVFRQTQVTPQLELIVVDNTPDQTAATAISELQRECPDHIKLIALHEPAAGVANARNHAMAAVKTDLVAFLDDDQSAPETWLASLLANFEAFPAAATFGPVQTEMPTPDTRHQVYFETFFAREPGWESGYIQDSFGCGNALIDFSKIPGGAPWFDTDMNEIGGEDDLLFARIRKSRGRFAWAANARVLEHPPAERVTFEYTLKRAFSYGQAPITLARRRDKKRFDLVVLWMLIGAGKTVWHGLLWALFSIIRHPNRAFQLDRAVRGVSKILWWIDLRFYGAAALKPEQTRSPSTPAPVAISEPEQV